MYLIIDEDNKIFKKIEMIFFFYQYSNNMSRLNKVYEELKNSDIEMYGTLKPPLGMPNFRFLFKNKYPEFNMLSVFMDVEYNHFETILKKDDECVYLDSIGYEDVCYFNTAKEIENEIKRIVDAMSVHEPH